MTQSRQLAAIMFTDIVGYTALMGEDEEKAFELLKKNRELHRPIIEKFSGRWLKEMGDGILATFSTVSDAVYCAKEIQEGCLHQAHLKLRIGIHLGEVVFEGEDVFGDGVNIASRLESLAPIGGILVSESVHNNVLNKKDIETGFVSEEHLKNVKESLRVYLIKTVGVEAIKPLVSTTSESSSHPVQIPLEKGKDPSTTFTTSSKKLLIGSLSVMIMALGVFTVWKFLPTDQPELVENRVAVAYFKNETGDPSLDYLERMTADQLRQGIGKVDFVEISRLVLPSEIDPTIQHQARLQQLSAKTGANIIVWGVFYKEGERLIFQPEVIDVSTGSSLKALQSISGELSEPSAIVDDLVQRVLSLLGFKFDLPWTTYSNYMGNVPTYDAYKEFKEGWGLFENSKNMEAIDRYETALQLDPTFIHAYLMIGIVFYEGGYNVEADSMVKFLNEIRSDYTLEERKLITWLEAMVYSDLTGYYKVSREIAEFDADWQWNVGWGAYSLNRLYEAEEWFSQVDHTRSFATTWEGYWAYYSATLHLLDKHKDELMVQKERKRHFPQSRMALVGEVIAHMTLGNMQEALDMKKNIYETPGGTQSRPRTLLGSYGILGTRISNRGWRVD